MAKKRTTLKEFEASSKAFISQLNAVSPSKAKKMATENLKAIGVLTKKGNSKKQIVNGDFFGW